MLTVISSSSESSTSDLESTETTANSTEVIERTDKMKVLFPCNVCRQGNPKEQEECSEMAKH